MDALLREETESDRDGVARTITEAFGSPLEATLVAALHAGGDVIVSLVAEVDAQIVGQILFSRLLIHVPDGTIDAVSLAPMSVLPAYQRQGIGSRLVCAGLEACRSRRERIVLVLGHPEFYRRFGFDARLAQPLASPFGGGDAWMALELVPGSLAGVSGHVEFAPPFRDLEA